MNKYEIWKAIVEEKIDVKTDKQNREWVDKKDFQYLFFEYRSLLIANFLLLLCIMVLAIMFVLSGIE